MSIVNNDVREDVRRMIVSEWGERDIDLRMNWLKECLQRRDHMTVFRLDSSDSSNDIDLAILQAMLKGIISVRSYLNLGSINPRNSELINLNL